MIGSAIVFVMKLLRYFQLACVLALLALGGCSSGNGPISEGLRNSPSGSLISGEIGPGEYLDRVEEANAQDREAARLEFNRDDTRAYNTFTGKVEYVPKDTQQYWNDKKQRWEFTPILDRDDREERTPDVGQ